MYNIFNKKRTCLCRRIKAFSDGVSVGVSSGNCLLFILSFNSAGIFWKIVSKLQWKGCPGPIETDAACKD